MGFEVENNNKRHQELWDQPKARPDSQQPAQQERTLSKNSPGGNSARQTKKASPALIIILTVVFIIIGILLSGVMSAVQRNRSTKSSEPIALSTRLVYAKDFIPVPDGMQIEKCELQGLYDLVVNVSGKAETENRDYATGSVFAFSLFGEIKSVTFTEQDTGKVYKFERTDHAK